MGWTWLPAEQLQRVLHALVRGLVMETISSFGHTDFVGVPSVISQNTNAPHCAQVLSLDTVFQSHIDFRTGGELLSLVNSPGLL